MPPAKKFKALEPVIEPVVEPVPPLVIGRVPLLMLSAFKFVSEAPLPENRVPVIVPAEKLPDPSLRTRVLMVFAVSRALVEISAKTTESSKIMSEVIPPVATESVAAPLAAPPERPAPAMTSVMSPPPPQPVEMSLQLAPFSSQISCM